jgi:heme a synthase
VDGYYGLYVLVSNLIFCGRFRTDLDGLDLAVVEFRWFPRVLGIAVIFSFLVMVLGSYVRATDSGLACPDWPLCFDKAVPALDFQIFLEWIHRVLAACLTLLFCYIFFQVVRFPRLRQNYSWQFLLCAVVLGIQIVLGGLTVLKLLDPTIVSLHLMNAVVFLSLLLNLYAKSRANVTPMTSPALKRFLLIFSSLMFVQLFLGGMVSTNHAGLACTDFPTCHGYWIPPAVFPVWLQMSHRYLAFFIAAFAFYGYFRLKNEDASPYARLAVLTIPALVIWQIVLGVINVYYLLPDWASSLHLGNALIIYGLSLMAYLESTYGECRVVQHQELRA